MARFIRLLASVFALSLVVAPLFAQQPASTSVIPPELQKLMQQIKSVDTDLLAVSEEDGRFLRVMVTSSNATRALEIGGANGYSAIWIGLGLRHAVGTLEGAGLPSHRAPHQHRHGNAAGHQPLLLHRVCSASSRPSSCQRRGV